MTADNLIELRSSPIREYIIHVAEIFEANDIKYIYEETEPSFDITMSKSTVANYIIKIKKKILIKPKNFYLQIS
jgi:hypothetical protein